MTRTVLLSVGVALLGLAPGLAADKDGRPSGRFGAGGRKLPLTCAA